MTLYYFLFLIITASAVKGAPQLMMEYPDPEPDPINPNANYYEINEPGIASGVGVIIVLQSSVNQVENVQNSEDDRDVKLNLLLGLFAGNEETSPNLMEAFVRKAQQVLNKNESYNDGRLESLLNEVKGRKRITTPRYHYEELSFEPFVRKAEQVLSEVKGGKRTTTPRYHYDESSFEPEP